MNSIIPIRRSVIEDSLFQVVGPSVPVLPYDGNAARWHAVERGRLSALGRMPSLADGQIAAIAATQGLILVTRNLNDYRDFAGVEVADWFIPQ